MTKKFIKLYRLILISAVALSLMLSAAAPAFATEPPLAAQTDRAAETDRAAITKLLQVPYGTAIPSAMSFAFEVAAVGVDGDPYDYSYDAGPPETETANMPTVGTPGSDPGVGTVTILFGGAQTLEDTVDGISTYYLESANIFAGVAWTRAGVYEYEITENETASYQAKASPPPTEVLTYSDAVYTVYVYVKESALVPGTYEITHIGVLRTVDDEGDPIAEEDQEKVDPTPGGGTNGTDTWDYSQMTFTNSYYKTNGGTDPEDPNDWTLAVSKKVEGDFADTSIYFNFSLTLTAPALVSGAPAYEAYVVEADTSASTGYVFAGSEDNYSGITDPGDPITFTSGSPVSFKLKHGQSLVFTDTPVGTTYAVSETNVPTGYRAGAIVTYNGTPGAKELAGSAGADLFLPHSGNTYYKSALYVGEAANSAAFLNDRGTTTPAGISIAKLPYYVMIGVVILIIVCFAIVRSRKYARQADDAE